MTAEERQTINFVVPWYGPDVVGGAERACRQLASRLASRGANVRVLTTCARDLFDWSNHHPPGVTRDEGVPVHRFTVDPRDQAAFDEVNIILQNGQPTSFQQHRLFVEQIIRSTPMCHFITRRRRKDLFLFTPYMFGTTYWGCRIAPDRSYLMPCLHDEPYLWIEPYRGMFRSVAGFLFFSKWEARLLQQVVGTGSPGQRSIVLGLGVASPPDADPNRFRHRYHVHGPFALAVMRRVPGKNISLLLDYFARYVERTDGLAAAAGGCPQAELKLVLLGSGAVSIPEAARHRILDVGYVSEQDKADAYAAALYTCQPSVNESFSYTIMESWLANRPVLVHRDCPVTRGFVEDSGGGLWFRSFDEYAACTDRLLGDQALAGSMGNAGYRYVRRRFVWDRILDRLLDFVGAAEGDSGCTLALP
ncbi:MAG: glycosyltransferase family 4 protein [Candidatus Schekmanbacteria bacterium]|nr:glycosyltransferase family 4 protein [Candidatus Schekmanbacteria bacterium]